MVMQQLQIVSLSRYCRVYHWTELGGSIHYRVQLFTRQLVSGNRDKASDLQAMQNWQSEVHPLETRQNEAVFANL